MHMPVVMVTGVFCGELFFEKVLGLKDHLLMCPALILTERLARIYCQPL